MHYQGEQLNSCVYAPMICYCIPNLNDKSVSAWHFFLNGINIYVYIHQCSWSIIQLMQLALIFIHAGLSTKETHEGSLHSGRTQNAGLKDDAGKEVIQIDVKWRHDMAIPCFIEITFQMPTSRFLWILIRNKYTECFRKYAPVIFVYARLPIIVNIYQGLSFGLCYDTYCKM